MKKRFTEEQIIPILKEAEAGLPVKELCRKYNISDATFYTWRKKYGGLEVSEARRLKALEEENSTESTDRREQARGCAHHAVGDDDIRAQSLFTRRVIPRNDAISVSAFSRRA